MSSSRFSAAYLEPQTQPLPTFDEAAHERYPYGARSDAAAYVGDLLHEEVAALSAKEGTLQIVAIARRPGVLTKVAIRPRTLTIVPRFVGIGADDLARVSQRLDGERIQLVQWQRSASAYIADALGLAEVPPVLLLPGIRHARVLLGEIDIRGIAGWRGLNTVLASALTGWRIRLEPVAATEAWRRLHAALLGRRSVVASVIGPTPRGVRVEVLGLYAVLSGAREQLSLRDPVEVRVTRMDPDEGRVFVSQRLAANGQLSLI